MVFSPTPQVPLSVFTEQNRFRFIVGHGVRFRVGGSGLGCPVGVWEVRVSGFCG